MPESIRTYVNRCRACLEKFFDNEKISPLTNFITSQFEAFTNLSVSFTLPVGDNAHLLNLFCFEQNVATSFDRSYHVDIRGSFFSAKLAVNTGNFG